MLILKQLRQLLRHPECKNKPILTLCKVLLWKINQKTVKAKMVSKFGATTKLYSYPDSSYGGYVYFARYPEFEEMKLLESIVTPGDTFVDIGANIGAMSILAAEKAYNGLIYAIEPTKKLITRIKENIAINNFGSRVSVHEVAIADHTGSISFSESSQDAINHISHNVSGNNSIVQCSTLDDFCVAQSISKISVLKIDVEGAEPLIILGAKNILKNTEIIIFELNENIKNYGYTTQFLLQKIIDAGFFIFSFNSNKLQLINAQFKITKTINVLGVSKKKSAIKRILNYL